MVHLARTVMSPNPENFRRTGTECPPGPPSARVRASGASANSSRGRKIRTGVTQVSTEPSFMKNDALTGTSLEIPERLLRRHDDPEIVVLAAAGRVYGLDDRAAVPLLPVEDVDRVGQAQGLGQFKDCLAQGRRGGLFDLYFDRNLLPRQGPAGASDIELCHLHRVPCSGHLLNPVVRCTRELGCQGRGASLGAATIQCGRSAPRP